jgi:DNA-binding MarR family transcriptional regulator
MPAPEPVATPETEPAYAYSCARAWVALRQLHAAVTEALTATLTDACGLTINDFEALLYLQSVAPQPARLRDLRGVVLLSQPAISRLVTRLEQQGLVRRLRSDAGDDRRSVLLELTEPGAEVLRRAAPLHAACVRTLLTGRMSDEEQAVLLGLLTRLHPASPDG